MNEKLKSGNSTWYYHLHIMMASTAANVPKRASPATGTRQEKMTSPRASPGSASAATSATTPQYSADLNRSRARSRSTTIASATLWTRPALNPGPISRHMSGLNVNLSATTEAHVVTKEKEPSSLSSTRPQNSTADPDNDRPIGEVE